MFHEQIAIITRDHAREHMRDLLDRVNAQFDDKVSLPLPKSFDTASLVGGRAGVERSTTPSLALDCYDKQVSTDPISLWDYAYLGRFLGVIAAGSAEVAEKVTKRYAAAIEVFINEHLTMPHATAPFTIIEMRFDHTTFFGAAMVPDPKNPQAAGYWFDGFQIDMHWLVSENGQFQHEA